MTTIYIHYSESMTGGEIYPGQEDNNYPDRAPAYISKSLEYVTLEPTGYCESVETDEDVTEGDTINIVVVTYSDGDTFGTTYGYWTAAHATTDEQVAIDLAAEIEADYNSNSGRSYSSKGYQMQSKALGREFYTGTWKCYFGGLDHAEVHSFVIGNSKSGNPKIVRH